MGAYFIVDGTQSVGAMSQIDVQELKIDALICAGYKWLSSDHTLWHSRLTFHPNS